ncbi:hypothetical protein PanWU01x14_369780, partial [Parasponia andersonii]
MDSRNSYLPKWFDLRSDQIQVELKSNFARHPTYQVANWSRLSAVR